MTSITGAAAAGLQPNGQFTLATAPLGLVTGPEARAMSTAVVRLFGYDLNSLWEVERGGPIDYVNLAPCGRTFYARSPYEPLPSTASLSVRQAYGSYWLTTLCTANGDQEVGVGVPTLDTFVYLDSSGSFSAGVDSARFVSTGISIGIIIPPGPEATAQEVAALTQRRITQVPELVLPPFPYLPQLAKWRLQLESPVNVVDLVDSTRLTVSEVYFGYGSTVQSMLCAPIRETL